jgi:hypothetical protein
MLDRSKFKMKGGDQDWARMWPEKEQKLQPGDSIQGTYVDRVENYGSNGSNVYILEVDGERVGVWGSTVIDEHMKDVAIDTEVGIEYVGTFPSKNRPGKEYKKFLVGVIDDTFGERDVVPEEEGEPNPL